MYCKDAIRRGSAEHMSFDFLGFTFRARGVRTRHGRVFTGFGPAVSKDALNKISAEVRSWRLHQHTDWTFGRARAVDQSHRAGLDAVLVRHEALLLRMEVKDRPSPCCRSSRVKLEAA